MYHLISARRPDLVTVNKKKGNLLNCGLCHPGSPESEIERKRKERQVYCLGTEKTIEYESDGYTNFNQCARYSHQKIDKGTELPGNNSMIGDHPNSSIIKIGQNTEMNHEDLRRLAGT